MDTTKNTLVEFFNALSAEESEFISTLASDRLGLILRSAINELDWYYYNIQQKENPTFEEWEQYYLLQLGVTRLIKLSLESRPEFDVPTVMFCRTMEISLPVLEIVGGLGMIEHGRRVAQTVLAGRCRIESVGINKFMVTLPSKIDDDDYYEREVRNYYQEESKKKFAEVLNSDYGKKLSNDVDRLLTDLVFPFATHYIGYGADLLLDEYFFGVAYAEVQRYEGFDTFHYSKKFGGIAYQKYILSLTYLIGNFIRHERFAQALVAKDSRIKIENVLTISSETAGFIESMRDAINHFGSAYDDYEEINLEEATRVFQVLSVSRKNTKLLDRPGSPLPLVIQSSEHDCIRCLAGARGAPMQFLLDSLRHHFPADYDKHQQSREKTMQVAIKRVMDGCFSSLLYLENIKIRLEGREVTDIDLVILEKESGSVLLCQLKYQELYGADIYSQHLRTTRLKDQATRWLNSVEGWIKSVGEVGVRACLQLKATFPPLRIYRVVISKHYSYPLKDLACRDDVAYANWIQLVNSLALVKTEKLQSSRKLVDLIEMLKRTAEPRGQQTHADEPQTKWTVRSLEFTVLQEISESTGANN